MARKSKQVETRLVAEYLKANYGSFTFMTKVPLGVVPDSLQQSVGYQKAIGVMRPFRPEVDAVVVLPNYLLIIEAKVWSVVNGLAKLPLYKSLIPLTPEFKNFKMPYEGKTPAGESVELQGTVDLTKREVLMELVVGWSYANLEVMARSAGVSVKVFCPDWLQQVVQDMHKYWTKEYQEARNKRLALREYFGVE